MLRLNLRLNGLDTCLPEEPTAVIQQRCTIQMCSLSTHAHHCDCPLIDIGGRGIAGQDQSVRQALDLCVPEASAKRVDAFNDNNP